MEHGADTNILDIVSNLIVITTEREREREGGGRQRPETDRQADRQTVLRADIYVTWQLHIKVDTQRQLTS